MRKKWVGCNGAPVLRRGTTQAKTAKAPTNTRELQLEMEIKSLTSLVERIKRLAATHELDLAHSAEDELMCECLKLILAGHVDPKRVAQLGLSTQKLKLRHIQ